MNHLAPFCYLCRSDRGLLRYLRVCLSIDWQQRFLLDLQDDVNLLQLSNNYFGSEIFPWNGDSQASDCTSDAGASDNSLHTFNSHHSLLQSRLATRARQGYHSSAQDRREQPVRAGMTDRRKCIRYVSYLSLPHTNTKLLMRNVLDEL